VPHYIASYVYVRVCKTVFKRVELREEFVVCGYSELFYIIGSWKGSTK